MARYIVIRVESNATAETLLERFASVSAINVVGLFASPTTFCEGECSSNRRVIRSKKYGLSHCSECRLPISTLPHHPRNLLNHIDLHPRFSDMHLSVWEPFKGDPKGKYGANIVEISQKKLEAGLKVMRRYRAKQRREKRRSDG